VTVEAVNATTVVVLWKPPHQEDRNGIIQNYTLRILGVHTEDDFTISTSDTEITVGNLRPFYSYKFMVAAVTTSPGPFSTAITVAMPSLGK
jgi:receptor-type tyrosine-protein phosphatase Q